MTSVAMKSELDLFSRKPTQAGVLKCEEVALKPLAALHQNSQIEFLSLSHADTYRDLNSVYLRLRVKLMKDAIAKTAHTDATVGVVNNIIHSLFRQVTVYFNNKIVCAGDLYHYRSYIENMLNFSRDSAQVHLESSGWCMDSGKYDSLEAKENSGFGTRAKQFGKSVEVELCSKVHCDLFNQTKYLINGVDLRVIFALEKPEFYVLANAEDKSSIEILDATLFMNHVTIAPNILAAHQAVLMKGNNAVYPYTRVEVRSHTVSPGSQTMTIDNVIIGRIPRLMICALISNDAMVGKRTLNPFRFEPHSISQFQLLINGVKWPSTGLTFDYTNADAPISSRAYDQLFRETQLDRGHQITKAEFDSNIFLIACDLTADKNYGDNSYTNLASQGTVSIEARFSKALEKTISVIVYSEFDASLEITKNRDILLF